MGKPRPKMSPIVVAVLSGGGAFLAILVGLLTADGEVSGIAWVVGVMAATFVGLLAFVEARGSDKQMAQQKSIIKGLEKSNLDQEKTLDHLTQAQERLEHERIKLKDVVSDAGLYFYRLTAGDEHALGDLVRFLAISLRDILSSASPLRVTFLEFHPEAEQDGNPSQNGGGELPICTVLASTDDALKGHWVITRDSAESKVVQRFLDKEPPWENGLVITDTTLPDLESHLVLRAPNGTVASTLRMPVLVDDKPLGILCVDSEQKGKLDQAIYKNVVEPFAYSVAAGFAVRDLSNGGK